jgi:predicted HicB family RNase H-like nuclease
VFHEPHPERVTDMMTYEGYTGVFNVDPDAKVIRGQVVDLKDTITFQGTTVPEAMQAFRDSVDDYLEFCESLGEKPERPFSGSFLVRLEPDVHRTLTALAQVLGVSLNKFVAGKLTELVRERAATPAKVASHPAVAKTVAKAVAKIKAPVKPAGQKGTFCPLGWPRISVGARQLVRR